MDNKKNQEENVIGDLLEDDLILYVDNISYSLVVYSWVSFHAIAHRKNFLDYVQGDF
jgi:hypothetical protein